VFKAGEGKEKTISKRENNTNDRVRKNMMSFLDTLAKDMITIYIEIGGSRV
jgi:hypothetical protein